MSFYFYLARCSDDTLYAGYCKNLAERKATHNSGKGAKYTRGRGPVIIVYSEGFKTKSEAMKREYAVKKMRRSEKEALIKSSKRVVAL
jgi:putative endonuclease